MTSANRIIIPWIFNSELDIYPPIAGIKTVLDSHIEFFGYQMHSGSCVLLQLKP
jgi:hypothetical protein